MLKCILSPGCGRLVVAAQDIPAGAVVFREEAYTVAPNVDHAKKKFCVFCATPITEEKHDHCEQCSLQYCSSTCFAQHHDTHKKRGECAALRFCQLMRSQIPDEDLDTFQMTCLIIARCVFEGKEERLARVADERTCGSQNTEEVETVGFGREVVNPLDFLNGAAASAGMIGKNIEHGADAATYDHVECLVSNVHAIDPEIVSDFAHLHEVYIAGVARRKTMSKLKGAQQFIPAGVSRDVFVAICCAFLCNGFGFWDAQSKKMATAVYAQSSYFNHNCAPNLGRRNIKQSRVIEFFAVRDITAGEQLCISYVDVKMPACERVAKLRATYTFTCQCSRCDPEADYLLANTVIGDAVPPLCDTCLSKIMQPLGSGKYVCPFCDKVESPE